MQELRCASCKKFILVEADPVTDRGLWYHPLCYRKVLAQKIAVREERASSKTATNKQEQELQDLRKVLAAL